MKTIILILALFATSLSAQEYVQTYYSGMTNFARGEALLIELNQRDPVLHPWWKEYNDRLRPFISGEWPLLSVPPGSVIRLSDGLWTTNTTGDLADAFVAVTTNRYTGTQRLILRDLVQIGTNYGLTARQVREQPYRVLRTTLRVSETNTTLPATRNLVRTIGLLEALKRTDE